MALAQKERATLYGTTLENVDLLTLPEYKNESLPKINVEVDNERERYEKLSSRVREINSSISAQELKRKCFQEIDNTLVDKWARNLKTKRLWERKPVQVESAREQRKPPSVQMNHSDIIKYNPNAPDLQKLIDKYLVRHTDLKQLRARLPPKTIKLSKSGHEIPRNICHQYKYDICDSLIGPNNNQPIGESTNQMKSKKPLNINREPLKLSDYQYLGYMLRSNILGSQDLDRNDMSNYINSFDGWQTFRTRDLTLPTIYRMKSDDISKWSCANIVQKRVLKEWDIKIQELAAAKQAPS